MSHFVYFKTAFQDPKVAALTASSRYTIQKVLDQMESDCKYIVEYGAGEGVLTRKLLDRLPENGHIFAVERNSFLLHKLRQIADPRLSVIHDDVLAVSQYLHQLPAPRVDMVISGIPLSFWAGTRFKDRDTIMRTTHEALRPGGKFVVYQYTPILFPTLKRQFSLATWQYEFRNFPPYFVMVGEK